MIPAPASSSARRLERALPAGARHGRGQHGRGLALSPLGLVAMDEGTALAEVGEGDGVLPELEVARDPLEGRPLEAAGAGADHDPVEAAVGDHVLDEPAPLGPAEELGDGNVHDPVERPPTGGQRGEVEHARDVAPALAEEDAATGHRDTAWRAPIRVSSGSRS
jgi:hypothetical protein